MPQVQAMMGRLIDRAQSGRSGQAVALLRDVALFQTMETVLARRKRAR